jgi:hypothetical protein
MEERRMNDLPQRIPTIHDREVVEYHDIISEFSSTPFSEAKCLERNQGLRPQSTFSAIHKQIKNNDVCIEDESPSDSHTRRLFTSPSTTTGYSSNPKHSKKTTANNRPLCFIILVQDMDGQDTTKGKRLKLHFSD